MSSKTSYNRHGGKRVGAGRKKMSEQERLLNGQSRKGKKAPGNAEEIMENQEAELVAAMQPPHLERSNEMPEPNEYLTKDSQGRANRGKAIYKKIWQWLKDRDCHLLVNPEGLQQYALALSRCEQAELAIHDFGLLTKCPKSGAPLQSPFIPVAQSYQRQAAALWGQIEAGISDRLRMYVDKNTISDDPLDALLNNAATRAIKGGWDNE